MKPGLIVILALALGGACSTTSKKSGSPDTRAVPDSEPQAGERCGAKTCPVGQVCCNASCGICTPPDGMCTQQFCEETPAVVAAGTCAGDGDCHLVSDYCTGCDCRSLAKGEPDPVCEGPGVRCLMDPCQVKRAACVAGRCVAQPR